MSARTGKAFLAAIIVLSVLSLARSAPAQPPAGAQRPAAATIADAFIGEELKYRIGFWVFDNVAEGMVSFEAAEGGGYVATLSAYTTGVVDRVIRHRRDTYTAHMALSGDGTRLVTRIFEKVIDSGGHVKKTVTWMDFDKRVMTWKSWTDGVEDKNGELPIPPGVWCDDPLTAFYNLRAGVFGPMAGGNSYKILTFPKKDHVPVITMKVASREELISRNVAGAEYLAFAHIDKDLFGSQSGDIEIFFTAEMLPVEATAKDILFFGDVRGKLFRLGAGVGFKKTAD